MALSLTKCGLDDLNDLLDMATSTFVDAFESVNNPRDFAEYLSHAFSKAQFRKELGNPNSRFYFIYLDEKRVGYCKLNENKAQNEFKTPDTMELERIYVIKEFQGKGIGKAVLQQIVSMARTRGKTGLWLGVWESNNRAIAFYQRQGFKKVGTHPYYIGSDKQTDWLMQLSL